MGERRFFTSERIRQMWAENPDRNSKTYDCFVSPQGERVTFTNLSRFCREHGLKETPMIRVMKGKQLHHKGWTHVDRPLPPRKLPREKKGPRTWHGFVDPRGEPVVITNIAQFCRDNGLNRQGFSYLVQGRMLSYKGWTYLPDGKPLRERQRVGRKRRSV